MASYPTSDDLAQQLAEHGLRPKGDGREAYLALGASGPSLPKGHLEPDRVRIGPHVFGIHWDQASWDRMAADRNGAGTLIGTTDAWQSQIYIKPGHSETQKRDTLLHEILHAIFACTYQPSRSIEQDDIEEYVVASVTPWLLGVLADNPQIVDYLTVVKTL